jgi:hypothetical protein
MSEPGSTDAEQVSKLAEQSFTRLHKINPEHGPAWIERAQLYAAAGSNAGKPATLRDARQWLDNAAKVMQLKADTPEMKKIRQQIEQAERKLAGGGKGGTQ